MRHIKLISFLFIFTLVAQAQQLEDIKNTLSQSLKVVKSSKSEFTQSIETVNPSVVKITIEKLSNKGKTNTKTYLFNPSDINSSSIKKVVKKDVVFVEMRVNQNQKLILLNENEEKVNYVNSLLVYAEDINNARTLEDIFKEAIPVFQEVTNNRLTLSSYQEYLKWLENNVVEINNSKEQIIQQLETKPAHPGSIVVKKTINDEKSSTKSSYSLNLFSLNPKSISYKIKGNEISISLETENSSKIIKHFEDDVQENYTNKFDIVCTDVEQARDMLQVFKQIIPLAEDSFNNAIPTTNKSQGMVLLNKLSNSITANEQTIKQSYQGECIIDFNQEISQNGDLLKNSFNFNLEDIAIHKTSYNSKGELLFVDIFTKGKEPFIKQTINEEEVKYVEEMRIYIASIEDAVITKRILQDLKSLCSGEEAINTSQTEEHAINSTKTTVSKSNISSLNFTNIAVEEPSYKGQIFYVSTKNTTKRLEDNMYYVKRGASVGRKLTGFGKVRATIMVDGNSSPIKIEGQDKIYFICNYGDNDILPTKIIHLLKFEPKKSSREYVVSTASSVSGDSESNKYEYVKYTAKKYGNHSYLVEFTDLEEGEYGFAIGGEDSGKELYMFSVVN